MATFNFDHADRKSKFLPKKKNKQFYFKKKKQPLVLVFDEKAREDFLTGFRKRKELRKKQAHEELEKDLKAERTRIRHEAKSALKKLVVSFRDIPQFEGAEDGTNVVDMGTHEVQITELDPDKLARENNWIGPNHVQIETQTTAEKKESSESEDEIVGMETHIKKKTKSTAPPDSITSNFKTSKDVKKYVKKLATKNMQKSKAFQKKRDVEARKNKKKKLREEMKREKETHSTKKRGKRNRRN